MDFKKILNLLGIVLPALIILLGIIRLFSTSRKGHNALTMFFAVLLLFVGLVRFFFFPGGGGSSDSGSKEKPIPVSKHSEAFNQSLENVMTAYYKMTGGFVNDDTTIINNSGTELMTSLDSLHLEELKKDTTGIYETALDPLANAKTETSSIIADPSLVEKRGSFNILSDNLRNLLIVVKYDRSIINWLECPSAFGEDKPGNWLSRDEKSVNPYGQKDCAEIRTRINFVPLETTKNTN